MKINKNLFAALAFAIPIWSVQSVQATPVPITNWGIDLTGLNPTTVALTTYGSFGSLSGLRDIVVTGQSSVVQNLNVAHSPVGQSFKEQGQLTWVGANYHPSGSVGSNTWNGFIGTNNTSLDNFLSFQWTSLTGTVLNSAGDIQFDTGSKVGLYLTSTSPTLNAAGVLGGGADSLQLALFDVVPLSAGSGIAVHGGAFSNGVVGLTLDVSTLHTGVVFKDEFGSPIDQNDLFALVNSDATDENITTTTFYDGLNGTGNIVSGIDGARSFLKTPIGHDGSFVPAKVPEPTALALLSLGILSMGVVRRRKFLS